MTYFEERENPLGVALPNSGSLFVGTQANIIASRDLMIGTPVWNDVVIQKRVREDRLSRLVKKKQKQKQRKNKKSKQLTKNNHILLWHSLIFHGSWVHLTTEEVSLFVSVSWKEE